MASAPHVLADDANNPFIALDAGNGSLEMAQRRSLPLLTDEPRAQPEPSNIQAMAPITKSLLDMSLDDLVATKQSSSLPLVPVQSLERTATEDSQQSGRSSPAIEFAEPDAGRERTEGDAQLENARQRFTESAQRLAEARQRRDALRAHLEVCLGNGWRSLTRCFRSDFA
jgi:hypothetical protein